MHGRDQGLQIREHLRGRLAVVDVIAADVQHDEPRLVRRDQLIRVVDEIADLERIDAAIDERETRQVFVNRGPAIELGVAGKQDGALRRRLREVGGGILLDLLLEAQLLRL